MSFCGSGLGSPVAGSLILVGGSEETHDAMLMQATNPQRRQYSRIYSVVLVLTGNCTSFEEDKLVISLLLPQKIIQISVLQVSHVFILIITTPEDTTPTFYCQNRSLPVILSLSLPFFG